MSVDTEAPSGAAEPAAGTRLSNRLCAGYGVGMTGVQIFRDAPALLLLFFMTQTLGVPPAIAGIAVFLPKIWVVFADPLAGMWSDRTQGPMGRRRPFLLWGGIACGLTFIVMFNLPPIGDALWRAVWVSAAYTVALTAFAIYSVPYLTMASEMSDDPGQRTKLMSFRLVFMAIGLMVGGFAPVLVAYGGGGEQGYRFMSLALGALVAASMLITFFATAKARSFARHEATIGLRQQVRLAWQNKPFFILLSANFLQRTAEAAGYTAIAYFFVYILGRGLDSMGYIILVISAGAILSQWFWVQAAKRFGKMPVYWFALLAYVATFGCWALVEGDMTAPILIIALLSGVFNSAFVLMALSMLTDTIEYDRARTGLRREGVFSGLWMANEKVAFAFGALVAALVLGAFGFQEAEGGAVVEQSDTALLGVMIAYIATPIAFHLSSLALLRLYRLGDTGITEKAEAERIRIADPAEMKPDGLV